MINKNKIKCSKCNKEFETNYKLNRHNDRKIPCDNVIKCNKCEKIFKTTQQLQNHIKRKIPCESASIQLKILDKENENLKLKIKLKELSLGNTTINNINTINNITNNITLNNFGDHNKVKDFLYTLSLEEYRNLIDRNYNVRNTIENIAKLLYNNPNFPENQNIKKLDSTKPDFYIFLKEQWKMAKYDEIKRPFVQDILKAIEIVINTYFNYPEYPLNPLEHLHEIQQEHYKSCEIYAKDSKNESKFKKILNVGLSDI